MNSSGRSGGCSWIWTFSQQRLGEKRAAILRATESALRVVSQINLMAVQGAKRHPGHRPDCVLISDLGAF